MEPLMPGLAAVENVHPLVVHFPIVLWSVALFFWLLGLRGREEFWRTGRWMLYLGSLSALVAVATGLWAADQLGHDSPGHDLVHVHRNLMVAATALGSAIALLAWAWRGRSEARNRGLLLAGLALTTALCAIGADRGALLVYGHGIGTHRGEAEPSAAGEHHAGHEHGDHPH
jgi:uncharacterized membrane protein